jgi:hypothetical protein
MDKTSFKFKNATGSPAHSADWDFSFILKPWNDFGFTNICEIVGPRCENKMYVFASFRVIDLSGKYKPQVSAYRGHILSDYADGEFEVLPSELVSVFTNVKGCESILLCMSPEERKLLIKSLNICFPDSENFRKLSSTSAFKQSVCRDALLEDVIKDMRKCQELLTCNLDISQMLNGVH